MWKLVIPVWQTLELGPDGRSRRPQNVKYFEELINFRVTGKKWLIGQHFVEDAPKRPHIRTACISLKIYYVIINSKRNIMTRHDVIMAFIVRGDVIIQRSFRLHVIMTHNL